MGRHVSRQKRVIEADQTKCAEWLRLLTQNSVPQASATNQAVSTGGNGDERTAGRMNKKNIYVPQ